MFINYFNKNNKRVKFNFLFLNASRILTESVLKMAGVLFIVTIPTEQEEREQDFKENKAKFGHSSKEDISIKEADKFEYGTFKIV